MKTFILDGYNVIHAVPSLARKLDQSLEAARSALVSECRVYHAQQKHAAIYIVFDGTRSEAEADLRQERVGGIVVIFTRQRETADDRILSLLRTDRGRNEFVIVSNDTYVLNNSRAHGARVMSVDEFYAHTTPSRQPVRRARGGDIKTVPSVRAARTITEEYRRYLEEKH